MKANRKKWMSMIVVGVTIIQLVGCGKLTAKTYEDEKGFFEDVTGQKSVQENGEDMTEYRMKGGGSVIVPKNETNTDADQTTGESGE